MMPQTYPATPACSSATVISPLAMAVSDRQASMVETNACTWYERGMFGGSPTNPKVVVWHPDDRDFEATEPAHLFLQLIDQAIIKHPDGLIPADEAQIQRLKQLLKDVEA